MSQHSHKGRIVNGAFYFGPRADDVGQPLGDAISAVLDAALVAKTKAEYEATRGSGEGEVAKHRIGAGYIGVECDRELAHRYHKTPKEERESVVAPGELQRHAESGHWTEARTADWLRLAGFELHTHKVNDDGSPRLKSDGKPEQIGWKAAYDRTTGQARMAGEVDGVITGIPAVMVGRIELPCIWESKKGTAKKWAKFSKGVREADPKYFGQLQINMAMLEIKQSLFSMLNLDTMKYYWELIPFDQALAQRLHDRAIRVMESRSPAELTRIARDETDHRCRFCDFHGACWAQPKTVPGAALARPAWLTGPPA